VARTGNDDAADLLDRYWQRVGVDPRFVARIDSEPTGTSVGLIDEDFQPRFIHTSGANQGMTSKAIDPHVLASCGARFFHIAGFFVLPNLFTNVAARLAELRVLGIQTSLDVVFNVRMDDPELRQSLWATLPHLDTFIANDHEATRLTGEENYEKAAMVLKERGADKVVIKLGAVGCWGVSDSYSGIVPATEVDVLDTTGAGDAFAAGYIAAFARGQTFPAACLAGNQAGAKICTRLGAITAWLEEE
jgi:ribokinase